MLKVMLLAVLACCTAGWIMDFCATSTRVQRAGAGIFWIGLMLLGASFVAGCSGPTVTAGDGFAFEIGRIVAWFMVGMIVAAIVLVGMFILWVIDKEQERSARNLRDEMERGRARDERTRFAHDRDG